MSISTASISAGDGLQYSQKTTQPSADTGAVFNAQTTSASGDAPVMPATKVAANTSEGKVIKLSAEQIRQSLQDINKVLSGWSISVQFQIDPAYKDVIIKVVDQDSGKVIRQIPTEEVVRISKAMDNLKGLLFAQSV